MPWLSKFLSRMHSKSYNGKAFQTFNCKTFKKKTNPKSTHISWEKQMSHDRNSERFYLKVCWEWILKEYCSHLAILTSNFSKANFWIIVTVTPTLRAHVHCFMPYVKRTWNCCKSHSQTPKNSVLQCSLSWTISIFLSFFTM